MLVSTVTASVAAVWALGRSSRILADTLDEKIAVLERRIFNERNDASNLSGEAFAFIRAKMADTELWNRDHFVIKDDFKQFQEDMKEISRNTALIGPMTVKIETMWNYQIRRAMTEVVDKGVGTMSSPMTKALRATRPYRR